MWQRFVPGLLVFSLLSVVPGCNSGTSVSGQVSFNSTPVDEGNITFLPVDGKGPAVGSPIRQGRYLIHEIPSGTKLVRIEAVKPMVFATSTEDLERASREAKARADATALHDPADVLPPQAEGNNILVEIRRGHQTQDFHVERAGSKGR